MTNAKIIKPIEAGHFESKGEIFYTQYPLREWAPVKKIQQMIRDNISGKLCSLRFTWQRPKKDATTQSEFLYETLAGLIDVSWLLADSQLADLKINRVPDSNNLFALASFANGIVAEIEMNECLPDSMPPTYFVKANFEYGHGTNQPIVGHFNVEGAILANDAAAHRVVIENADWDDCGDEIAICNRKMLQSIELGRYPSGPLNTQPIVEAIRKECA